MQGVARFMCPKCGKAEIVRCGHCREIVTRYICPECGFEGPNQIVKKVIFMGTAVVTVKVMPESVDVDLEKIQEEVTKIVKEFAGDRDTKAEIEPVAFGLKALNYIFVMDEDLGSPDVVAEKVQELEGVQSAEVSDVRRAIG